MKKVRFKYIYPPLVTLVLYCIVLAVKGIYPFGGNTIDYYDMAQQIAAFYYHVYDALHGTKGFFYDWYTALGVNMAMSTSGCSNISPFNLFFLFIRRGSLLKSLSVFNGLKLMCASFTMFFYLDKTHEESPDFFKLAASVGYAFSGFVLVLYITNQWVDIAVMFPLIMYFYDRLIKRGRMTGYVITLAITIIASYYLGFMILIFIFLYTGLKLLTGYLFDFEERALLPCKDDGSETGIRDAADVVENSETTTALVVVDGSEKSAAADVVESSEMTAAAEPVKKKAAKKSIKERFTLRRIRTHKLRKVPNLHLFRLGLGTALSLALSAFIVVPQLKQMLSSARFSNGSEAKGGGIFGTYFAILSHVRGDYTTRWWTLLGLSFAAAVILTGIIRFRKDKKAVFFSVSLILMMTLELFFESINLIWHFGSYIQYPIRNGFIINFVFAYLSCYFAAKMYGGRDRAVETAGSDETTGSGARAAGQAGDRFYLSFIFTVVGFLVFVAFYRNHPGMQLKNVFYITSAIMAAAFLFYMVLINKFNYRYAAGVLACELLCFGFLLFGKPDFITGYAEEPEQEGEYIYICDQLNEAFDLEPGFLYRVKNPDESLNANYGFVLRQPALSNWTHMIAPGEQSAVIRWGYSIQFMRLLDSGGTVFSDALLGIRNVISCVPMDEKLYEPVDTAVITVDSKSGQTAEYTLYRPKYTLPFFTVLGGDAVKEETKIKEEDIVSLHNKTYRAIAGGDDVLAFEYVNEETPAKADEVFGSAVVESKVTGDTKEVYIKADILSDVALYLSGGKADRDCGNCTVWVNGDIVPVPTIKDAGNTDYPAHFNNNTLYLGCFGNEKVDVKVAMDLEKGEAFDVDIIGISLDAMDKVCSAYSGTAFENITAGNSTLTFTVPGNGSGEDGRAALLPLTYDKGWKVKVNGKKVRASSYAGLFTRIPLKEGENTVTMKFTPSGMRLGVFMTLAALVITIVYIVISRIKKTDYIARAEAKASPGLTKAYAVAACIVAVVMYVIPIIYGICVLMF
ncbi:MAG: YfhO family protein [Lachnospiraceae bacterium]|nr:YfhO family protein [Lachnospiraceae bacterium]